MLIENEAFDPQSPPPAPGTWGEAVFRYCTLEGLALEGLSFDGIMQSCTFTSCRFYWGFFNCALLDEVRFVDCTFPGTSFRTARLLDCTFERCSFDLDNLGGDCTIADSTIVSCAFDRCRWIAKPSRGKRDITNTRWLDCRQNACQGFDRLF
jgi:uncharacterized protein YjbI with pentapeptide repeats